MARNMAMRRCKGHDDVELSTSERVMTPEGFLRAPGTISRTGIQEYTKKELNLAASLDVIRLYRPPEEVFSEEAMASADGATMTLGHPDGDVTSGNWRTLSVGEGIGPENADPLLRVRALTVRDEWAIYAVIDGVDKISCGYTFDLDMTPGLTPEGQPYDGIMRNIRINHIAIVYAARCGNECNIADAAHRPAHDKAIGRRANDAERARLGLKTGLHAHDAAPCGCGGNKGTNHHQGDTVMKKINVGGIELQFEGTTADVVGKFVGDAEKAANDSKSALDAANARADKAEKELAAANAKIADLTKANDEAKKELAEAPARIEAAAAERTKVIADALVIDPKAKFDGKTTDAIRSEALTTVLATDGNLKVVAGAALAGVAVDKADAKAIKTAFDAVVALARTADRIEVQDRSIGADNARALSGAGTQPTAGGAGGKIETLNGSDSLADRLFA